MTEILRPTPPPGCAPSSGSFRESLRKKIAVLAPPSGDLRAVFPQAAASSQEEGGGSVCEDRASASSKSNQDPSAPTEPRPAELSIVSSTRRARFRDAGAEEKSNHSACCVEKEEEEEGSTVEPRDEHQRGLGSGDMLDDADEAIRTGATHRHLSEPTPAARARQPVLFSSSYQFSGQSQDDSSAQECLDQSLQERDEWERSAPSSQDSINGNELSCSESEDSEDGENKIANNVTTMNLSLRLFQSSRKSPADTSSKRPFAPMRPTSLPGCKDAKQLAEAAAAQELDPTCTESTVSAKCALVQGQLLAAGDDWTLGIPLLGSQLAWCVAPPIPGEFEGIATICIVPDREWTRAQACRTGVMTCIGPVKDESKSKRFTTARSLNPLSFFKRRSSADAATSKQKDAVDTAAKNPDAAGWLFNCMEGTARWVVQKLLALGCVQVDLSDSYELVADQKHGAGSFGCVVRAVPRHGEGGAVAMKLLKKGTAEHKVLNEVEMLVAAQGHPQIIGFLGTFRVDSSDKIAAPQWALAFDLHYKGDLYEKVAKGNRLQEREAMPLFIDLLNALAFLGDKGIFHRDIKPENMLVGRGDRVVITDFGIACRVTDEAELKKVRGTVGYASPEMLRGESVGIQGDAFGAGIVLFFMLSRSTPFYSPDVQIMAERTHLCRVNLNYACFEALSTGCRNIMLGLIEKDVKARLTAKQVLGYRVVMQSSVVRTEPSLAIMADMGQPPIRRDERFPAEGQARRCRARAAALEERQHQPHGYSRSRDTPVVTDKEEPSKSKDELTSKDEDPLKAQHLVGRYRAAAASSAGNLPPLRRVPESCEQGRNSNGSAAMRQPLNHGS